jgi:peptidoglycan/LPS O-acetylase OafA/YrhL
MTAIMAPQFSDAAFAAVLGFACVIAALSARSASEPVRSHVWFAAGLGAALAVADAVATLAPGMAAVAGAVELLAAALAPVALVLAAGARFARALRTPAATAILASACAAGLFAAATGSVLFGFAPLAAAAAAMGGLAARIWHETRRPALFLALSSAALVAAAASEMSGDAAGRMGFGLFFAVALLGSALAVVRRSDAPVKPRRRRSGRPALFIGDRD